MHIRTVLLVLLLLGAIHTSVSAESPSPLPSHSVLESGSSSAADVGLLAQWPEVPLVDENDPFQLDRGPGAYFAWYKLAIIAILFVIWLWLAEFVNIDSSEMHEKTRIIPQVINPLNMICYFVGLLVVLSVPIFWLGLPVYALMTFLPFGLYLLIRNNRVDADDKAFTSMTWFRLYKNGKLYRAKEAELAALQGPEIDFAAGGATGAEQQHNLIAARQAEHFPAVKAMMHDAITKRASSVIMDFTQQAVNVRMEVDGFWHQLPVLDRPTGDSMLVGLKKLGGLNPQDRRHKQRGRFTAILETQKTGCEVTSQGVSTGEQAIIRIAQTYAKGLNLAQVGMWPEMVTRTTEALNTPGLAIVSAPPSEGLSTTWAAIMQASDRIMRDVVSFVSPEEMETKIENVERLEYVQNGKGNVLELQSILLRNPDAYVLPEQVSNPEFYDILLSDMAENSRTLITKVHAGSAAEAILRIMKQVGDRKKFAEVVSFACCQRLVRRLCDQCKQPVQVNPNFLKQLGVKPGEEVNFHGPYKLPPPEQRVDEDGNLIEMEECSICNGLGYVGRIAIVETLVVDDEIRKVLTTSPKMDSLTKIAQARGNKSLVQQGYRLAMSGVTSVQEVQRVFQPKKK